MVFNAKKTSLVDADGADKEHYRVQASLCNVGSKWPAAFFVLPSLAPQDKLATYHAEFDPVLDEWHVTHNPKEFVDAWGTNPKTFGEPRHLHEPSLAISNVVKGEKTNEAQYDEMTAEALCNNNEHPVTKSTENQLFKDTKPTKSNNEHAEPQPAEQEAAKPLVAESEADKKGPPSMVIDTKLAQDSYEPRSTSSMEANAHPSKSSPASPQPDNPPSTASTTSQKDNSSSPSSVASSPKQQGSPSTSLSSTPEKKTRESQISVPAVSVTSPEPNNRSSSAAPESTLSIFSHLSTKGKGGKKGKGKKAKASKNSNGSKSNEDAQKSCISPKKDPPLPNKTQSLDEDAKAHGVADSKASANKRMEAEILSASPTVLSKEQTEVNKSHVTASHSQAESKGLVEAKQTSESGPPSTTTASKPENSSVSPKSCATFIPANKSQSSTSSPCTGDNSILVALPHLPTNGHGDMDTKKDIKSKAKQNGKTAKKEDCQPNNQSPMPSTANQEAFPSPSASPPDKQVVPASSSPPLKAENSSPTPSSSTLENATALKTASTSPETPKKLISSILNPSPAQHSSSSALAKKSTQGKGKKKGRAGKKVQAKKAKAAEKNDEAPGAGEGQHQEVVDDKSPVPANSGPGAANVIPESADVIAQYANVIPESAKLAPHDQPILRYEDAEAHVEEPEKVTVDPFAETSPTSDSSSTVGTKQMEPDEVNDISASTVSEEGQGLDRPIKAPSQDACKAVVVYKSQRLFTKGIKSHDVHTPVSINNIGCLTSPEEASPVIPTIKTVDARTAGLERLMIQMLRPDSLVVTPMICPFEVSIAKQVFDKTMSPVFYNSNRLLLPARPSMSSEKTKHTALKGGNGEGRNGSYLDEVPDIAITNTDHKAIELPSGIDACPRKDAAEGAFHHLHHILPQGTPLTLGVLKAWVTGGEHNAQTESPPVERAAPLTDLAPAEKPTQVVGLSLIDNASQVDSPALSPNITQLEDIAQASAAGDSLATGDSLVTVMEDISESPPAAKADLDVATAHGIYNPHCLLLPGETSWFIEKTKSSSRGDTSFEELMPKSEIVNQQCASDGSLVDVVVNQDNSVPTASPDLNTNATQADTEQLKQKDITNAQASTDSDSLAASVEDPLDSPSKANVDVDAATKPAFYNPDCLLLPGETSWFLENMRSSAKGDTDIEELRQKTLGQQYLGQYDDHQQETDAATTAEQGSDSGLEFSEDLHDNNQCDTVTRQDNKPHELEDETVNESPNQVNNVPQIATPQENVEQDIPGKYNRMEVTATIPQPPREQADPTIPFEATNAPEPAAIPVLESQATSILGTQKLAEVAAMVSDATATLAQSLRNNPFPTAFAHRPVEQNAPNESAKEFRSSIFDTEKLVKLATTIPETREERFSLLELIFVLIARFVGSLFM